MKKLLEKISKFIRSHVPTVFPTEGIGEHYLAEEYPEFIQRLIHFNRWFIRMRWLACAVSVLLSTLSVRWLECLEARTLPPLLAVITLLGITNITYSFLLNTKKMLKNLIELQMFVDLVILTILLHFSGGIENPLIHAYVFHVIIAGILLNRRKCYAIAMISLILSGILGFLEMNMAIEHYTLEIFPHVEKGGHLQHSAYELSYVATLTLMQTILLFLVAYFTTVVMERLRWEEGKVLIERRRLNRVIDAAGAGFAILDRDLHPIWLNEQIKKWLKIENKTALEAESFLKRWFGDKGSPAAKTFQDSRIRTVEREIGDNEEETHFFQVTIAPLLDNNGRTYQVVELTQDITERKKVEAQMMHSDRMAVLGSVAAGITHEIGNPLASMSTRLQILKTNPEESFLKESLSHLQTQIARIVRIIQGISQFAKLPKQKWSICDINQIISETVDILKFHPGSRKCKILTELTKTVPKTTGVKDQLVQVFVNIALNGLEAMPDGGTLLVKSFLKDREIHIDFSDTGIGMDEGTRSRIFDLFYTSKDKGLGLGLCITNNIVSAHGGRIEVESKPGEGAKFSVVLPVRVSKNA